MGFELLAQLHDVDFERVREPVVPLVPHLLVDPRAAQHLVRVPQEEDQQGLLLGGQVEPLPGPLGPVGGQVEPDVGVGQDGAARSRPGGGPGARTRASSSSKANGLHR